MNKFANERLPNKGVIEPPSVNWHGIFCQAYFTFYIERILAAVWKSPSHRIRDSTL